MENHSDQIQGEICPMERISFQERNFELITLMWLDKFADATQENREIQDKLRSVINYLKIFDNCELCRNYIEHQINDRQEKIILIVSGQFGQDIIEYIHNLRQIISIFVFCGNKEKHELWAKKYNKIRNIIVELNDLLKEIQLDTRSDEQKFNQSIELLTDQNEILSLLLQIKPSIIDKRYFLNICHQIYKNNPSELENVEEFEHLYSSSNALKLFFNETFLYRLLIKSLQIFNIEILYLLRFYLQDINQQLQISPNISGTVYRGQLMTIDQIEFLNQCDEQTILRLNSFLIAHQNEEQILNSLQNSSNTNGLHKVLFQIDSNQLGKVFKELIIFPITTRFRIISIHFQKRIWFVQIKVFNFNSSISNPNPIQLAHYLREIALFDQSEILFNLLLKQYPKSNWKCYDGLGRIAQDKGLYDISRDYYLKSLQTVSNNYLSYCLNNLACVYDYLKEYDIALQYSFQSLSLTNDDRNQSISLNNIGIIYANNGEYEKAIQYLKNCLSKRKKFLKENDIDIGICYTNLGVIYLTLQQFDNASKYFHLALKSFQLNKSNIFQAILYQNMAQLFQQTNLFNKSLQFYQDALLIFKQFKPPNHPNITFIQQQIHLLKQLK